METYNKLPLYKIKFNPDDESVEGIDLISFVKDGGKIKVKLDKGTFILKRGECLTVEILLPPTILRQINLHKLGIE